MLCRMPVALWPRTRDPWPPASPQWIVARMLKLTGAEQLMPVFDHRAEALAAD